MTTDAQASTGGGPRAAGARPGSALAGRSVGVGLPRGGTPPAPARTRGSGDGDGHDQPVATHGPRAGRQALAHVLNLVSAELELIDQRSGIGHASGSQLPEGNRPPASGAQHVQRTGLLIGIPAHASMLRTPCQAGRAQAAILEHRAAGRAPAGAGRWPGAPQRISATGRVRVAGVSRPYIAGRAKTEPATPYPSSTSSSTPSPVASKDALTIPRPRRHQGLALACKQLASDPGSTRRAATPCTAGQAPRDASASSSRGRTMPRILPRRTMRGQLSNGRRPRPRARRARREPGSSPQRVDPTHRRRPQPRLLGCSLGS
jgi:hypothetical protein